MLTESNVDYTSTELGECFLHVIETGDEYNLRNLGSYEYDATQPLSIRCDVSGTPPDRIIFLYGENELHTERTPPYFMRGEQTGGTVNIVPYLSDSCGTAKSVVVIGLGYSDEYIFDQRFDFVQKCSDASCIVPPCGWTQVWDSDRSTCVDNTMMFLGGYKSSFACPLGSYNVYGRHTNTMTDCECCAWYTVKDVCANQCLTSL